MTAGTKHADMEKITKPFLRSSLSAFIKYAKASREEVSELALFFLCKLLPNRETNYADISFSFLQKEIMSQLLVCRVKFASASKIMKILHIY